MRRPSPFAALSLFASVALSCVASAQSEPNQGLSAAQAAAARNQTATPRPDPIRPPMPIIDVEFPGGSVQEFVSAIQKAASQSSAKTPVNVMVPSEAADVPLPAVSLKRVSAETALQTLRHAFGNHGPFQLRSDNMTSDGDEGLTFALQFSKQFSGVPQQVTMHQPAVSQAYSLRGLLIAPAELDQNDSGLRLSADAVLGALKLASELEATDATVAPTQLLYHEDTKLLIARGTPDQHRLIEGVIEQITATLLQRRAEVAQAQDRSRSDEMQILDLESQGQAIRAQFDRARSELGPATAEVKRLEQLVASGAGGQGDLERAKAQLQIAETNVGAAEAQMAIAQRRREILRTGNAGSHHVPKAEKVVVVYDVRDLANFKRDFMDLVKQVIGPDGKMDVVPASGDSTGSLVVKAGRDRQEILVNIFNTARRLKANEPKLPGATLDQLIQKSPKE